MASRLAWFATAAGRRASLGFMTAASISAFALEYFPQTFFLSKYQAIAAMYQSAMPVPVSNRLMRLWDETLADLSLPGYEVKFLRPFTVFGFDIFRAGTVASKYGAIIGLPINYTYTDVASLDPTPILVKNESVNWNRQDAKQLLESLILSDNAKRYGIAREILMARYNAPVISAAVASLMVSSTYILCRGINEKLKLFERPYPIRGFFYVMGGLFGFVIWATQNDIYNTIREKETDEHLAQLDDSYAEGAIEFYSQLLKKHTALRSLMGTDGEGLYTSTGNEKFFFRQPRLPIDKRKEFFEKALAERRRKGEMLIEETSSSDFASKSL